MRIPRVLHGFLLLPLFLATPAGPASGDTTIPDVGFWGIRGAPFASPDAVRAEGSLRSPVFRIAEPSLAFQLAGGSDMKRLRVELHVVEAGSFDRSSASVANRELFTDTNSDRLVERTTGPGGDDDIPVVWDVRRWIGAEAYLRVVDSSATSYIRARDFRLTSGDPTPPLPSRSEKARAPVSSPDAAGSGSGLGKTAAGSPLDPRATAERVRYEKKIPADTAERLRGGCDAVAENAMDAENARDPLESARAEALRILPGFEGERLTAAAYFVLLETAAILDRRLAGQEEAARASGKGSAGEGADDMEILRRDLAAAGRARILRGLDPLLPAIGEVPDKLLRDLR